VEGRRESAISTLEFWSRIGAVRLFSVGPKEAMLAKIFSSGFSSFYASSRILTTYISISVQLYGTGQVLYILLAFLSSHRCQ
jgi:hypothetical protein